MRLGFPLLPLHLRGEKAQAGPGDVHAGRTCEDGGMEGRRLKVGRGKGQGSW